jgi:predicted metalloendopeptidase
VVDEVGHCFSADTVAECRARVQAVADSGRAGAQVGDWVQENWAVRALAKWDTIQPAVVEVRPV